jgi:hypothetical protein
MNRRLESCLYLLLLIIILLIFTNYNISLRPQDEFITNLNFIINTVLICLMLRQIYFIEVYDNQVLNGIFKEIKKK